MINFNNILIHEGNKDKPSAIIPQGKYRLDFRKDILKEKVLKKFSEKELRLIEPGNKIPLSNYQQLGQFCDVCDDTTPHVRNPETKNIRCLICKTKTKY